MNTEPFHFKQFHVHHHLCAHKVGTDGVLLGAWAEHNDPKRILDVGSGSGLVGFMLAQRYPQATFVGIEQHEPSITQARQSLAEGPFSNRGCFIPADFLKWITDEKFDLIVSNPPFFEKAQTTAKAERDAARRQFSLPHVAMLEQMVSLLKPEGKIALVLPVLEAESLETKCLNYDLHIQRICRIQSFPDSKAIRHLIEFGLRANSLQLDKLAIRNKKGEWSEAYKCLTREFYL